MNGVSNRCSELTAAAIPYPNDIDITRAAAAAATAVVPEDELPTDGPLEDGAANTATETPATAVSALAALAAQGDGGGGGDIHRDAASMPPPPRRGCQSVQSEPRHEPTIKELKRQLKQSELKIKGLEGEVRALHSVINGQQKHMQNLIIEQYARSGSGAQEACDEIAAGEVDQ